MAVASCRTPKEDADWKTAVRVGQKIDQDRRKDLLAKAEKMAVRMRQSFLEIDTSGDSRLDPDETMAMFEQSEAALSSVSCRYVLSVLHDSTDACAYVTFSRTRSTRCKHSCGRET